MPEHGTRVTNDHCRSRVPNLTTTNHRSGVHNTTTTNHQSMFHNTYKGEKPFSLICVAHCFTTHQGEKPPTTDLCCSSFSPHQDPMASMIKTSKISLLIYLPLVNIKCKVLNEDEILRLERLGSDRWCMMEKNLSPNRSQTQSPSLTLVSSPKPPKLWRSSSLEKATSTLELDRHC